MTQTCRVAARAPEFQLACTLRAERSTATLSAYAGRWLLLVFFPRAFSQVCPTEIGALAANLEEFRVRGCDVLGISVDDVDTLERWTETPVSEGGVGTVGFPLASDPDGAAASAYGTFLPEERVALRGLFIVDPEGVLKYSVVQSHAVGRGTDETLRVLDALQSGGLCAADWRHGDEPIDPARELRPGRVISRYRVLEVIASGGCGTVVRAKDLVLGREVALKVLRGHRRGAAGDLIAEARAAAALSHPNVCTIYAIDDREGVPVIAMEHLAGGDVAALLARGRPSPARVRSILLGTGAGLAAAHAAGIVHGDLKPSNVLLTLDGVPKLVDFGLAVRVAELPDGSVSLPPGAHSASGSPRYLAPERWTGVRPDVAGDVFAFGALVHEVVSGAPAFDGDSLSGVRRQIESDDRAALAADLPAPYADVVRACLAVRPEDRPASVRDVLAMLASAPAEPSVTHVAPSPTPPTQTARTVTAAAADVPVVADGGDGTTSQSWPAPQPLLDEPALRGCRRVRFLGQERPLVGRAVLLRRLGQGGMGVVYVGINPRLRSEVAVKLLSCGSDGAAGSQARFFREAQIAARLSSEHLVGVFDVDRDPGVGCFYIEMEFVRGQSASAWSRSVRDGGGRPQEVEALDLAVCVARALTVAHAKGVVHRDVKPANVLLPSADGDGVRCCDAKLADLGLARADRGNLNLTETRAALGTPGYMAPEQYDDAKNAGPAADVFGLGATMYAILAGVPPFAGATLEAVMHRTLGGAFRPLASVRPDVSARTAALVTRCLAPAPESRPRDGAALLAELEEVRRGLPPSACAVLAAAEADQGDAERSTAAPR